MGYQKREKTSQYKGVYFYKPRKLWRARMRSNEGKLKFGGNFKDELDAAKRVNQLCEELGIPLQNPEISAMPNQQHQHDQNQMIENPAITCEILKTDDDNDAKKKKRKGEKEFNDIDDELEIQYFYDHMLK